MGCQRDDLGFLNLILDSYRSGERAGTGFLEDLGQCFYCLSVPKEPPVRSLDGEELVFYCDTLRIRSNLSRRRREFLPGRGSKSRRSLPLAGAIVARIQLLGNKFLHAGKIAENNRENLLRGVRKVWNTGVINPIQKLITEREALLPATEPLWPSSRMLLRSYLLGISP